MVYTIVTPINKNYNSKSNRDYREQKKRSTLDLQIMWDDAKANPTKHCGGCFAFVRNGQDATFHVITNILDPSKRLSSWSDNVGQTDRNVLYLSPPIFVLPWSQWLSLGCPSKIQGTTRIVSAHESLNSFIQSKIEYVEDTGEIIFK